MFTEVQKAVAFQLQRQHLPRGSWEDDKATRGVVLLLLLLVFQCFLSAVDGSLCTVKSRRQQQQLHGAAADNSQ